MRIPDNIYSEWGLSRIHSDWAILAGYSGLLHDEQLREEALVFARQIMSRARTEFARIVEELNDSGYRFAIPERAFTPPEQEAADWIAAYRQRGVHLPLALEAWCLEVGSINLMGSHPDWGQPGYAFDGEGGEYPLIADPFVCELSASYVDYLYDEWLSEEAEDRGPFRLDISPDHLHKANISGGPPYQIETHQPAADALVLNCRHGGSFVGLVRHALSWRGFPGFAYIPDKGSWSAAGPTLI